PSQVRPRSCRSGSNAQRHEAARSKCSGSPLRRKSRREARQLSGHQAGYVQDDKATSLTLPTRDCYHIFKSVATEKPIPSTRSCPMNRSLCLIVSVVASLVFGMNLKADEASASVADPAATKLLAEARAARALYHNFPGFSADIEVNLDGKATRGRVEVSDK